MFKKYYKGFSTKQYESIGRNFSLSNVDLIVEDLYNELNTIKGERLNMPDFGTRIPLLVFEPNDPQTAEILKEDVEKVLNGDPRIRTINLDIISLPDDMMLVASAKIEFLEFDVVKDLRIEVRS